ncbi:hypothetical protein [Pseudomonas aeruginosa]|uniref:hypothetical protein n=1 Tax=Pseudomonas aeruginosa TaxID=287 RepID=UPI00071BA4A1|nr:hypothetical protein [Pseudomonas aeruginosa]ELO0951733.1 hypothetical protein [Pseudomonas aeruginosa]MBG6301289.1 hypothetical protein [Pseudomonas aeruginosa]MBH4395341.1 hypothetical protein [Pseudomonas aeruginosa]MBI8153682.1 hypothetical protein [Pseudomonas aeruginosa]MDP5628064.1 hypothetical protein [Pseudomonas aeruginosa]
MLKRSHGKHRSGSGKPKQGPDYASICLCSDGAPVVQGFERLGPINKFEDLLCPQANKDPATRLAAEQIFHMIEGWRYVSAATTAYLSHSKHTALHFAYYAELRAAISLLSWSGIRVRQKDHYYLDATGSKKIVTNSPTHKAVWGLWQHWVKRPDAEKLFREQIRLTPGVCLADVLKALQYVKPSQTLQSWGIDLAKIQDDHTARNNSSYEAFWIDAPLSRMTEEDLKLILTLWKLLLPQDSGLRFDSTLISFFVKEALPAMQAQTAQAQEGGAAGPSTLADSIEKIAATIAQNTGADLSAISRRLDLSLYETTPFSLASSIDTKPENVLCRAFFLLRLSMLATKLNLSLTRNNAATEWLANWFEHAGLWSRASLIEPHDSTLDYELALEEFEVTNELPLDIWSPTNAMRTAKLTRPDACLIWNIL